MKTDNLTFVKFVVIFGIIAIGAIGTLGIINSSAVKPLTNLDYGLLIISFLMMILGFFYMLKINHDLK